MASTKHTAVAETKPIKIQLAKDEEGWNELKQILDIEISNLLSPGGEQGVKAFMFIVDVLSNDDIDAGQQAMAAEYIQQSAFAYSRRCFTEMERYLNELNPGRVIRRRKVVVHA